MNDTIFEGFLDILKAAFNFSPLCIISQDKYYKFYNEYVTGQAIMHIL